MAQRMSVSTPRFWWRATRDRIADWVPSDPDEERSAPRWPDRDHIEWSKIARAVSAVGDALAAESWSANAEDGDRAWVTVDGAADGLEDVELQIVRSWFSGPVAVRFDPWFQPITNGRHRLWATRRYFGDDLVPICGDALGYATTVNVAELGPHWPALFASNVNDLRGIGWFDDADPLNARFAAALQSASEGLIPSQI